MYPSSYGEKWESSEEKSSKKKNRDKKDSEKRRKTSLVDKNFEVLMGKADFQEQRASLPPGAFKPDEATQFLEERKALREKEKKRKREAKKRSKKAETADVLETAKKDKDEPAAEVRSRISASEGNLRVLSGTAKFTEEHAEGNYEVITAIREQERRQLKQKKKRESALKRRKAMWKKIIKRVTYATILAALVAAVVYVLYLAVDN